MCNCMKEKMEKMKEVFGYDYVLPPVDMLSGRCFITFKVKEPGKKKDEVSMLLSKCPFCEKAYDSELAETAHEAGQDAAAQTLASAT